MRFELISHHPGIGGYIAEFHPGPDSAGRWSGESVFMDGDVFEALVFNVGAFTLKRPAVTVEGDAIERLAEELDEVARQVSHADSPKSIWPYSASYGYTQFNSVRDWPGDRQAFTLMLRDLGAWLRKARNRGLPVTIRCM
jgi:hypothetical protein